MLVCPDGTVEFELDTGAICMEDRLRSLGILSKVDDPTINSALNSAAFKSIDIQTNMSQKKVCLFICVFQVSYILYFYLYYFEFVPI